MPAATRLLFVSGEKDEFLDRTTGGTAWRKGAVPRGADATRNRLDAVVKQAEAAAGATESRSSHQREVAAEHGATFLDANALLGPVWDSSGDWNHWDHEGFAVMADLVVAARDRLAAA